MYLKKKNTNNGLKNHEKLQHHFIRKCLKKKLPESKEYVICNEDVQSPYHCFTII